MSCITLNEHKELTVYTDSHSQQASCRPLPALLSSFSPPPAAFSPLPHEDDGPQAQHAYKVIHKSITGGAPVIFRRSQFTFSSLLPLVFSFSPLPLSSFSLSPSPPGSCAAWQPPLHDDVAHVPMSHTHTNDIAMTLPK